MIAAPHKVAVIGGGISGLACAYRLRELAGQRQIPLQITLFEASSRLGGVIQTEQRDGFILELGPDTFISQKPWAVDLTRRLGFENELIGVTQAHQQSAIVYHGRLRPIPKGFYLLASPSFKTLCALPFISFAGKCRMALEPLIPAAPDRGDESVASFIRRRFGEEALWRIGQPMIGGIYTADPESLSLEATFPRFRDLELRCGSVLRGLRQEQTRNKENSGVEADASGPRYRLFLSFKRGMQTWVDCLTRNLKGVSIQTGKKNVCLNRTRADGIHPVRWRLGFERGDVFEADAVCLALPVRAAEKILQPVAPEAACEIEKIGSESAVTLNFAFRREDCPRLPQGAGFVVPKIEGYPIAGVTFAHQKFEGRAPRENVLIRAFTGGFYHREFLKLSDDHLVPLVLDALKQLLGIHAGTLWAKIQRHEESMPQFAVGHRERVSRLKASMESYPGLFVTGNYLSGVGIPDCIHESEETAGNLVRFLKIHQPSRL